MATPHHDGTGLVGAISGAIGYFVEREWNILDFVDFRIHVPVFNFDIVITHDDFHQVVMACICAAFGFVVTQICKIVWRKMFGKNETNK